MGKFLKDALLGFAKGSAEVAKQEYEADLQKRKIMDETPELIKRYQAQQGYEADKENAILTYKMQKADEIAKQYDGNDPDFAAAIRLSPIAYGAATSRANATARNNVLVDVIDTQKKDKYDRPLITKIPRSEFIRSFNADEGRYFSNNTQGLGVNLKIDDSLAKDINISAKAAVATNLLAIAVKKDKTKEDWDALDANGLVDLSTSVSTNPGSGRINVDLVTMNDKQAAQLYQKIEEISSGARHSLYGGALTHTEVQKWESQGLNTKDTMESILNKLPSIIKGSANDMSHFEQVLVDKGASEKQIDSYLMRKNDKPDLMAGTESLDSIYKEHNPRGDAAVKPTSSNTFDNLPPSPSASASASSLTAPSPIGPNMPMTDPRQAISTSSSGGAPMADISQPSQVPTQEGIDSGIPVAAGDKSNSPEVMKARLMALKSKYGIGSTQYKDAYTTFKQQHDAGQQ